MFEYPVTTFKVGYIIIGISYVDLEVIFPQYSFKSTSYFP